MAETGPAPKDGSGPTVRSLLDRSQAARPRLGPVRADIVGSWWRSASAGLTPDRFEVPYDTDIDDRGRLAWAAEPVLDRMGEDLRGTRIGLLLTDGLGRVVMRRAGDAGTRGLLDEIRLAPGFIYGEEQIGTNAIGTALQRRAPTVVEADEHFAEALVGMACAAATVTDPATGRIAGVVDLSCTADQLNPLMLPLAKRAVWEIEQRLLDDSSAAERLLKEHFLRARRASRAPLVAVSERALMVNAAAANLVESADRSRLWDCALAAVRARSDSVPFALSDGSLVTICCQPVMDGTRIVGSLVRVDPPATPAPLLTGRPDGTPRDVGWNSLTEAELAVAAQVSRGLTNREAASQLFLSPHTIDFHLRQLFRKLDINSRVELTRIMLNHENE
ncbi:MAG: sigma-54 dependent transcriptional regulator, acetoin dehydrogenase operon transcriptional [Frankiales bacterium]|nr:sigma-54 dependent transcriptional regulator, acetoin dehydrogenase operon transcriptional [Frankiales bacterium]